VLQDVGVLAAKLYSPRLNQPFFFTC
jgi:hypothetical protein